MISKKFITDIAREAGNIALKKKLTKVVSFKINDFKKKEIVTNNDKFIEKYIVKKIKNKFPEHNILGEEFDYEKTSSPYMWVIDPIDGTINYTRNHPHFCTSIAVLKKGEPIITAIYDPNQGHMFFAEKGKGAFLNNKKIHVSNTKNPKSAIIELSESNMSKRTVGIFNKLIHNVYRIRIEGSTALSLCYVAAGWTDCRFKTTVGKYDVAGGALLVREAGGVVVDFKGKYWTLKDHTSLIATNKYLKKKFLDIF